MWERKGPTRLGGHKTPLPGDRMPRDIAEALRKARKMGATAALDWADASLATIGRNLSDHRRHPESGDFLQAALSDAAGLYAVLQAAVEAMPVKPGVPAVSADLGVAALRQG